MSMDEFERHPLFFEGVTWENAANWNDQAEWESSYAAPEHPNDPEELGRDGLLISSTDAMVVEALIAHAGVPATDGAPPLRILDAGCGFLNLPILIARLGCLITTVDFSPTVIRLAEWAAPGRARWPIAEGTIRLLGEEVTARLPVATTPREPGCQCLGGPPAPRL